MSVPPDWYAIRVKSNREQVTAQALENKGFPICLPVCQVESQRTRGVQILKVPLFAGYIFSQFDLNDRLPVLTIPGVVGIVGFGKAAEPVDPREMAAVLALAASDLRLSAHPYLPVGQRVRVQEGPLRGIDGVVVENLGSRQLVVSITLLQRSVAVPIERHWLWPVGAHPETPLKKVFHAYANVRP